MERKVTQIALERASEYNYTTLFALCEDGTMWMHEFVREEDWHWKRIKGIPERAETSALEER
jgi:tRNA G37 N-methylase Trm5